MIPRKLAIVLAVAVLFIFVAKILASKQSNELFYRCVIKANASSSLFKTPLKYIGCWWRLSNKSLSFKEVVRGGQKHEQREIIISVGNRQIVYILSKEGEMSGFTEFGDQDGLSGDIQAEQIKILFHIFDFIRQAQPDDSRFVIYRTAKNIYSVEIEAIKTDKMRVGVDDSADILVLMRLSKSVGHHADVRFWVAGDGNGEGKIVKCEILKANWPDIIVNLENNGNTSR